MKYYIIEADHMKARQPNFVPIVFACPENEKDPFKFYNSCVAPGKKLNKFYFREPREVEFIRNAAR